MIFLNRNFLIGHTQIFPTRALYPGVNIKETTEHYEVEVAAPGMSKEDFRA
jgi:HSP20 family molecular chaperone IbpA